MAGDNLSRRAGEIRSIARESRWFASPGSRVIDPAHCWLGGILLVGLFAWATMNRPCPRSRSEGLVPGRAPVCFIMLTLQILDQDQVFFHSLDRASTLLGSDERADVRLSGEGVVPQHARIECVGEQSRLVAVDGEIVRNGKVCRDVVLALGDRLELGSTVVVIGQSV